MGTLSLEKKILYLLEREVAYMIKEVNIMYSFSHEIIMLLLQTKATRRMTKSLSFPLSMRN